MSAESPESLNLTTINNDCKELIFERLEWPDLVNLADASKQLYASVCRVFNRKYGNAKIDIGLPLNDVFCMEEPQPIIEPDICISNQMTAIKFLRNFGHLIVKLHVDYHLFYSIQILASRIQHPRKTIEHYLAEYCSESLVDLSLENCEYLDYVLDDIHKPFTKVKTLHIAKCEFGSDLPFNRLFPKLHTLKLGSNLYHEPSKIRVHFPTIRNLYFLDDVYKLRGIYFQEEDIASLFKLNPQLEIPILYLYHEYSSNLIPRIKEYCPNLQVIDKSKICRYTRDNSHPLTYERFFCNISHKYLFNRFYNIKDKSFPTGITDKYKTALIDLVHHF